jgi:hypothetical protein
MIGDGDERDWRGFDALEAVEANRGFDWIEDCLAAAEIEELLAGFDWSADG